MILYTIGKRIKNFVKVTVLSDFKKNKDKIITGDEFLKDKLTFKEGKVCWYYENGNVKSECTYKNSMLEGISTHYFISGNVKAKETYKQNKLDGLSIRYYENGRIMSEESYRSGTLITRISFDSYGNKTIEKRD